MTKGEAELVPAFERAFAACKKAGLLVMVTTSHSAPCMCLGIDTPSSRCVTICVGLTVEPPPWTDAAPSVSQKLAIVDSWAGSDNIDIFSPQLYTTGVEEDPEFTITQCGNTLEEGRTCTYERLKKMKAKWVPSLSKASHYPAVKKFFSEKGITVRCLCACTREAGGIVGGGIW